MDANPPNLLPRKLLWPSLLLLSVASVAQADTVKITAVNGEYDPNRSAVVEVRPGDTVDLAADVLGESPDFAPQERDVSEFTWSSNAKPGDECDAEDADECQERTNFEVTDYGVKFYVPEDMGEQLTIRVKNQSGGDEDEIFLKNVLFQDVGAIQPQAIVTSAEEYKYSTFDPALALVGQGRWVVMSGTRYWVPYSYRAEWQPYQNGYWTWTDEGQTWVSYDPWGWVTDHYGVWRYHGVYGWVWEQFDDLNYRPHTVTWFHNGSDYVGWYPYYAGYSKGYRHGYDEGFRDGYWGGYEAGQSYEFYDRLGYRPGFTMIRANQFNHRNMYEVRVSDIELVKRTYGNSYRSRSYGQFLGGTDLRTSRVWIEQRCGSPLSITTVATIRIGNRIVRNPRPLFMMPDTYRSVIVSRKETIRRNVSVGSIIERDGIQGRVRIVRPTTNGRGIANAPRVVDRKTGRTHILPPQAKVVARPNRDNPIYKPVKTGPVTKIDRPVYKPGEGRKPARPRPTPDRERPEPVRERPAPAPRPEPVRERPEPVRERPEPVRERPEPVRERPRPDRERPEPIRERPRPDRERPEPIRERPAPAPRPEPVRERPEPVRERPAPAPRPEPVRERPRPDRERPEPVRERPSPPASRGSDSSASGGSRSSSPSAPNPSGGRRK